jgi:hypothetical protein
MEITMNIIRLFAVAFVLGAAAAFSPLANAQGVEVHAGGLSVGIGDHDRDCRAGDDRRDCRRSDPSILIVPADRHDDRNDRDHHEHDPDHAGNQNNDKH